jgi:hypothetical protein
MTTTSDLARLRTLLAGPPFHVSLPASVTEDNLVENLLIALHALKHRPRGRPARHTARKLAYDPAPPA